MRCHLLLRLLITGDNKDCSGIWEDMKNGKLLRREDV